MADLTTIDVILANDNRREPITVYERATGLDTRRNEHFDEFTGAYQYNKGRITPLDHDSYSIYHEICKYEWVNNSTLTVWYEAEWLSSHDFDLKLEQMRKEYQANKQGAQNE